MNISFARLGKAECETCEKYKLHENDSEGEGTLPNVDMEKLKERGPQMESATDVKLEFGIFRKQI